MQGITYPGRKSISGEGINEVRPNEETDPKFAKAYKDALKKGVDVLFLTCSVDPDELVINYRYK
ncbi:MAG: hypothetical protein E7302_04485 [Butyrivibrio sp.]|nr:hypothetical protein [Butyrivibrio sp.]